MRFKVKANPKNGTCFQHVEAETEEEAVEKAKANPNGWEVSQAGDMNTWLFRAYKQ